MSDPYCFDNNDYYVMREQGCKMCSESNPILNFFVLTCVGGLGTLFAMWFVAFFIYVPQLERLKDEDEEKVEIPFELKYPIKYAKNQNNLDTIDNCSVFCTTPNGEVYMKYNKENEGFDYWSTNKNIKYKYLETVARKFVTVFKCSELYIMRKATDVYFDLQNDTGYKLINDILYSVELDLAGNYIGDFEMVDAKYLLNNDSEEDNVENEEEVSDENEETDTDSSNSVTDEEEEENDSSSENSEDDSEEDEENINVEKIMGKLNCINYKLEKEEDLIIVKKQMEEKEDDDSDDELFVKSKVKNERQVKVPELIVANKYRYNGKIEDIILLKKVEKKNKKKSFGAWKKGWF